MPLPRLLRTTSFRLILLSAAIFTASVAVLFAIIYWSSAGFMSRQLDEEVAAELRDIETGEAPKGLQAVKEEVEERIAWKTAGVYYLLQDRNGHVMAGNLPAQPPVEGIVDRSKTANQDDDGDAAPGFRGRGMTTVDDAYLLVAHSNHVLNEMQRLIKRVFGLSVLATLGLAAVGGIATSAMLLRRVEAVSRTSRAIIDGDLSRRMPVTGTDDEFDHLAGNLNVMLDRIQGLMEGMRQVSNDIAHDLRTPLTRLRQRLERGHKRARSAEELRETVAGALGQIDEILDTFGAILSIAQIEAGSGRTSFTEVDLSELAASLAEFYQPVAEERGQALVAKIERGLRVHGDRELLVQMMANVIENAIRHSPDGTGITVGALRCTGGSTLFVSDGGPGIPEDLRDKVFQRFFRLEASRSTPGNGLGLSLVAAVAALHGVTLRLADNRPGLKVEMNFFAA